MKTIFRHNELDTITENTPFKSMGFYTWLSKNYHNNLTGNHLTSIYQFLDSLGYNKGINQLSPTVLHYLKNCYTVYVNDNIGELRLNSKTRIHELSNMLEHAIEATSGAIYLNCEYWSQTLKSGWYVPTGKLKATLNHMPTVYGTITKENHSLNLRNANTSYNSSPYPFVLEVNLTAIAVNKQICKIFK